MSPTLPLLDGNAKPRLPPKTDDGDAVVGRVGIVNEALLPADTAAARTARDHGQPRVYASLDERLTDAEIAIVEAGQRAGRKVAVNQQMRWDTGIAAAKDLITRGVIGRPTDERSGTPSPSGGTMRIDAHQHFWNLDKVEYPWLGPRQGPIYRTFEPPELEPQLRAAGIDRTVLVQAADSFADTDAMLHQAETYDWIGGVVGWVPLLDPAAADRALERYARHPKFKGVRHLIHDEPDPDWVVREPVIESLKLLAARGVPFDVVAVFPNHLKHVPTLAERVPNLTLIIDHLAKPPIKERGVEPWASQLAAAAHYPTVYAKVSGLNTAADWETWTSDDLRPYIDVAFEHFGADRLLFGSDWPVATFAGNYAKVWAETNRALEGRSQAEIDAILGGTAARVYRL